MRNRWLYWGVKRKTLLLVFFSFHAIVWGQVPQVQLVSQKTGMNNEIPKSLQRKFRRDAARLALRLEAEKEDLRYLNIGIPQPTIDMIYSLLTRVYTQDEAAKSIAKCKVHTFPNPSIDQLVLIYDKDIDWAAPLNEGISETESPEINDLLDEYELVIEKQIPWNDTENALTIRSKEPLNMAALANEFLDIEGVVDVDLGIPKVAGNDITLNRVQDGWELQYMLRFGTYADGKKKRHIWIYRVLDDENVKFLEESGSPIPNWMRCNAPEKNLMVFKG